MSSEGIFDDRLQIEVDVGADKIWIRHAKCKREQSFDIGRLVRELSTTKSVSGKQLISNEEDMICCGGQ